MTFSLILDIALVVVLLVFWGLGVHRGFILTLCSLAAVIVALIGAQLTADFLAPKLAEALEPKLAQTIQIKLEEQTLDAAEESEPGANFTKALAALREKGGIYAWAADKAQAALEAGVAETSAQAAVAAASAVAEQVAHAILFLIGFLLVLVAWTILAHALDLVAKLPGINGLNKLGGGLLGLVKGLVIVYVAAWALCDLTAAIPAEAVGQTHILSFLRQHSPLDLLLMVKK